MEVRFLVRFCFCASILLSVSCGLFTASAAAAERQEIRFYKVNKNLQSDRIWFTKKKGRAPGCHNFLKKTRVYKAVQFGFESCTLYSKKACAAGSEIAVTRKKDPTPLTQFSQGFGWLPASEHKRGVKLRSWSCQ